MEKATFREYLIISADFEFNTNHHHLRRKKKNNKLAFALTQLARSTGSKFGKGRLFVQQVRGGLDIAYLVCPISTVYLSLFLRRRNID